MAEINLPLPIWEEQSVENATINKKDNLEANIYIRCHQTKNTGKVLKS